MVAILVVAFLMVLDLWPHVESAVAPPFRRMAQMGLALACLVPAGIYRVFHAHPFDVTVYRASIEYEFASREYAEEFRELNRMDL